MIIEETLNSKGNLPEDGSIDTVPEDSLSFCFLP